MQAAAVSALAFAVGAVIPIVAVLSAPASNQSLLLVLATLLALGLLGAHLGGASQTRGTIRVLLGGVTALLVTTAVGRLLNVSGL